MELDEERKGPSKEKARVEAIRRMAGIQHGVITEYTRGTEAG
jgi:hypothetical protein